MSSFKVEGLPACLASAYDPNRLAIIVPTLTPPSQLYKYNIGRDPDVNLLFTFDVTPSACTANYFKEYTVAVTKKDDGSAV
jgi:hypothetical protein